jgi:hypothetical protein
MGLGVYSLQESGADVAFVGTGLNLGLGVDYFFSRHFGIGAEFVYKKLDFVARSEETDDGNLVTDLNPNLNGDTTGFFLTLTIQ